MKWISVKNKLPDLDSGKLGVYVLGLNNHGITLFGLAKYDSVYGWNIINQVGWYTNEGSFCFDDDYLTHWMPFPNPPERLSEETPKGESIV